MQPWRQEIERLCRSRFYEGNQVELLYRGPETFQRIFEAVAEARHLVCLEFYIYRNDETGLELAELLKAKAREGVRVYLLYDHWGSFGTPRSFWRALREAGVQVAASHPFKWASPGRYLHRDHKKLIVLDGRVAFTGGLNIADEYRGGLRRRARAWRDTGVLLRGPVARGLLQAFRESWEHFSPLPLRAQVPPAEPCGSLPVIPIFASSSRGRRRFRRLLYWSIGRAQESIHLTTAYFCPSRAMLAALRAAARRGVKIRLLLPGISDVPPAQYAAMAHYEALLREGVELYHYQGEVLHAKSYVFDRRWSIVGSANLDFQSLRYNDEGNVGILSEEFARQMLQVFREDLEHSQALELRRWRQRPLCQKLKERFFVLFRRRL
jgi:cardiolipin synthase